MVSDSGRTLLISYHFKTSTSRRAQVLMHLNSIVLLNWKFWQRSTVPVQGG